MVISFSRLGHHGRLANQMFQIAGTIGLAAKHNAQAVLPRWKYEDCFNTGLPHGQPASTMVKEQHFNHYDWQLTGSADLIGYMQSHKYFATPQPFVFKKTFLQGVQEKVPQWVFKRPTIAIHIRRGDYVGNKVYYQLPITYFISALDKFYPEWQESNLVILSDDIPYCKIHFGCLDNVYFEDGLNEIEAMALGSLCNHFILSNSSFSWWMAWIGATSKSKVIHPGHLFAGALAGNNTKDFWPEHWTPYQEEGYKIALRDTTFTVPVFYDHKDRKQNLDLSICMLQNNFDTNVIVGECKSDKFGYMGKYCKYVWFPYRHFHRTKMLNEMARMADGPIIANWDADVVLPPMQVYLTVLKIRAGADMVFPYDGRFARWERAPWFKELEQSLDVGVFKGITPTGTRGKSIEDMTSVGGAVFFNKQSFIAGGMENEHMISFGPEDCERNDRFTMLGYHVTRVKGYLHHINHWCGPDSSKFNIYFKANHAEIEKIRAMDKKTLLQYVKGWPWLKPAAPYNVPERRQQIPSVNNNG